ncbi:MAG TPA: 30S ribosomal protein S4, partial [Candidatus Binatus sp.]|nr:30S ribosomal protein S4 [Candidatus Binatus sp.]
MGDPRKPKKAYETPRHPWRKEQLDEELRLLGEYGLRNKHELRRHETALSKTRGIARALLGATEEERTRVEKQYLVSLVKLGILKPEATVDDILDLDVKDLMERRLQTMVYRNGLAKSIHQARQFVTHGHISIGGSIVSIPGYIVRREEETRIAFHLHSALNNPQHPSRTQVGGARAAERPARELAEPGGPVLPPMPT